MVDRPTRFYRLLFSAVAAACFLLPTADAQDGPGTPISHGGINVYNGEEWAHMLDQNEFLALALVDPKDDDEINGVLQGSYYDTATWDGGVNGNCDPVQHATNSFWYAIGAGSSSPSATLHDISNPATYDDPDAVATLNPGNNVNGFEVKVEMRINGKFSASEDIWRGETKEFVGSPTAWSAWVSANGSGHVQGDEYVHIQLDFKTAPSHAAPRKNISATVSFQPSATWEYEVADNDWLDGNQHGIGLTVGLNLAASASITYNYTHADNQEAAVAGVWTYSTQAVGASRSPIAPDLDIQTAPQTASFPLNGTQSVNMSKGSTVSRQKGQTLDSTYTLSRFAEARGGSGNYGQIRQRWNQSKFTVSSVGY